jgi:hypothetical protein
MTLNWEAALPWMVVFVVVLGLYLYVRSRRLSKTKR